MGSDTTSFKALVILAVSSSGLLAIFGGVLLASEETPLGVALVAIAVVNFAILALLFWLARWRFEDANPQSRPDGPRSRRRHGWR